MNGLAKYLAEEMTPKMVNLGFLTVPQSVVISWGIIGLLGLFFYLAGRSTKLVPHNVQLVGELLVETIDQFVDQQIGRKCPNLSVYIGALTCYLTLSNLSGLLDITPPTKDLNVTVALALISWALIYGMGLKSHGIGGVLHHFCDPVPMMFPFHCIDMVTRPLSLCMRLFGNIFGAFVIMALIHVAIPAFLPPIFGLYFDLFDGLIQMLVFVFLTVIYIADLS